MSETEKDDKDNSVKIQIEDIDDLIFKNEPVKIHSEK